MSNRRSIAIGTKHEQFLLTLVDARAGIDSTRCKIPEMVVMHEILVDLG